MRSKEEDEDIEIPGEGDENVGEGSVKKKKEKKRKSKEERIAERKVIFWTLLIIMAITIGFWLIPRMGDVFSGEQIFIDNKNGGESLPKEEKKENKNYIEITL